MIIAFTATGPGWDDAMDPRFGRARYLLLFDDEADTLDAHDNAAAAAEAHGAGPRAAGILLDAGADVLVTGNGPGGNAARVLAGRGLTVHVGAGEMTVREALAAYRQGELGVAG